MNEPEIDIDLINAKAGSENFPVAIRFIPKRYRSKLLAFYGFARLVDDLGDEYEGDRLKALDWASQQLEKPTHLIFLNLQAELGHLDQKPFTRLIEANRLDQTKHRYESFEELYSYCELSANPVGRVVLDIFGADSLLLDEYSDSVCTGLQILEHLQDMAEDYGNGRIYLPLSELERYKVKEADLGSGFSTPEMCKMVMGNLKRVRELLAAGSQLTGSLKGLWAKMAVSGYAAGGMAAADALAAASGDIHSPAAGKPQSLSQISYFLKLLASRGA